MSSPILRLPLELLEKIVLELHGDPASPPAAVLPLLLTSKYFYRSLGFQYNNHLYASLFRLSFDSSAPVRRLGYLNAPGLCSQLRSDYSAINCIRRGDIHADNVPQTFWTCFSMLLENDGKNRCQLDAAGLPDFVDSFIRERLYEHSVDGWPAENDINSLALWLLWLTITDDRLSAQTPAQRAQMTRLILPFVLMPVRYPAYLAPHTHYTLPLPSNLPQPPHSFLTLHGPYPQYRNGFSRVMPLYHVKSIELGIPLASVAAKLIYFSHREVFPVGVPPHLPRTRAHALQLGLHSVGPTQEDVQELNDHKVATFVPKSKWEWWDDIKDYNSLGSEARSKLAPSARWDDDWNRLADCNSLFTPLSLKRMHYTPGLLSGLWQGRMLYPDDGLYGNVMQIPQIPPNFNEQSVGLTAAPVFIRLREYHCMDVYPNEPVHSGGIQNAWFPSSARFHEVTHGLAITCQERSSTYNEYVVGGPDLHDESRCRGCEYRGTSEMIFREDDVRYLAAADDALAEEDSEDAENDDDDSNDDSSNPDVDMASGDGDELVITRKCDGILDIVLLGETDHRHGQAWHHYKFFGRIREWDGLVALVRVPAHPASASLGVWIFTGYVVGGQNFVGNWRTTTHPGELVTVEGAFAMSKRE
ncbi:hypothetical protein JVT61DRAFT_4941 [Boletus reticuloceps]|uniref:F-box domain-containing protein n=1 Tax=Boletus reticuloceps TaxID=495285 RepID=A0A8I2Z0M0_9AGAM|nr:hypothetical protein JVT61DRAFT_4941 [Boletus reticuloceps]